MLLQAKFTQEYNLRELMPARCGNIKDNNHDNTKCHGDQKYLDFIP